MLCENANLDPVTRTKSILKDYICTKILMKDRRNQDCLLRHCTRKHRALITDITHKNVKRTMSLASTRLVASLNLLNSKLLSVSQTYVKLSTPNDYLQLQTKLKPWSLAALTRSIPRGPLGDEPTERTRP